MTTFLIVIIFFLFFLSLSTSLSSQGDVDAIGGGEALAEPLEEGELEQSTTATAVTTTVVSSNGIGSGLTSLTNGTNGVVDSNGKTENEDLPSPACELKVSTEYKSDRTTAPERDPMPFSFCRPPSMSKV